MFGDGDSAHDDIIHVHASCILIGGVYINWSHTERYISYYLNLSNSTVLLVFVVDVVTMI